MNPDYNMSNQSDVLALQRAAAEEASILANTMDLVILNQTEPRELGGKQFDDRINYDKWFVSNLAIGKQVWIDAFEDAFRRNRRWRNPPKTTLEGWVDGE